MSIAVSVGVTTLKLRGITKERDEDDARDRDVVLERVEEEDQTAEQREQRECEARRERVTDEDVAELRSSGLSEDEIFELTVAAAVGAGLERLYAGLRTLG